MYESVDLVAVSKDSASCNNSKLAMTRPRGLLSVLARYSHDSAPYQRLIISFVLPFVLKALVVQSLNAT